MYHVVLAIHIIVCIILIAVILLQAGRGAGLGETFGGASQTIFGQKANEFLKKATEISAVIFLITCMLLSIINAHRGRSLLQRTMLQELQQQLPLGEDRLPDEDRTALPAAAEMPSVLPASMPVEGAQTMNEGAERVSMQENVAVSEQAPPAQTSE